MFLETPVSEDVKLDRSPRTDGDRECHSRSLQSHRTHKHRKDTDERSDSKGACLILFLN